MSARAKRPTTKPPPVPARAKSATLKGRGPTPGGNPDIYDSGNFRREPATPIKAISMKTPGDQPAKRETAQREAPKVKLRALSELHSGSHPTPQDLGYLAPPADPAEMRARKLHDYILYGSISVIVASVVALIIWFAAR